MESIQDNDSKYRKEKNINCDKQKLLDKQNQNLIDSLFQKYKTYLGKKGEVNVSSLKLLLDRIATNQHEYQFFGSQLGVPLASEQKIIEIKRKYNIK